MSGNISGTNDVDPAFAGRETATAVDTAAHAQRVRETREREIRLLAGSPWFDSQWYTAHYPDIEAAGANPIEHFVFFGWREHRNPSAFFHTTWYLVNNPDVDQAELNPLVHFIEYGEAENRLPNPDGLSPKFPTIESLHAARKARAPRAAAPPTDTVSVQNESPVENGTSPEPSRPVDVAQEPLILREREDIALLQSSTLFDADWYRAHYPHVAAQGMDPERHYLQTGAFENHDPSPRFRSAWYLATYTDVADIRLNPLIHFLRYGQKEGRKAAPDDDIKANVLSPDDAAIAAQTAAGDVNLAIDAMKPTPNYVVVSMHGQTMGMVAHDWEASPPQPLQALLAMARLHGWDDRFAIDLRTSSKTLNRRETPTFSLWDFKTLAAFDGVQSYIADGWFAGDYDLRLRVEPQDGVDFTGVHRLRFHQSHTAEMVLCGESLLRGAGPAFIDIKLVNPLKPLLITVTDEAGILVDATLVPFPSLLRGGAHHAEVVAMGERAARMTDLLALSDGLFRETVNWDEGAAPFSIARIDVDLHGALGNERIFDPMVRDWLAEVFKLGISAINADFVADRRAKSNLTKTLLAREQLAPAIVQAMTDRRLGGHTSLIVPPDALPSLSAIASRRLAPTGSDPVLGCFLVADAVTGKATLSVTMPSLAIMDQVQPNRAICYPRLVAKSAAKKPIADPLRHAPWPLAIRFADAVVNPALTLLPHAPDAGTPTIAKALSIDERAALSVVAVVSGNGGLPALERLLPSLAAQDNAGTLHIVYAANRDTSAQNAKIERLLGALFPARYTLVNCASVRPAAQVNEAVLAAPASTTHFLFIDASMVLHDTRTLDTLLAVATREGVGSVGCPHVRQITASDPLTVSAGAYFPVRLSLQSNPGIVFEEPKTATITVHATMPVAANNLRFALVAAAAWRQTGGLAATLYPVTGGDIEFGLRAWTKGFVHLNTSAVTVTDSAHRPNGAFMDVVATNYLPVQSWQDIAASTALVRELR